MLIHDRVLCNFCFDLVGQLFNQNAQSPDLIEDHTTAPHWVVCQDCMPITAELYVPQIESRFNK